MSSSPGLSPTLLGHRFQLACCTGWGISDLPVGRLCCPGGITTNTLGGQNFEGQAPSSAGVLCQGAKGRSQAVCPDVPAGTSTAPGGGELPRSRCWAGTESRAALCRGWHWADGNPWKFAGKSPEIRQGRAHMQRELASCGVPRLYVSISSTPRQT